MTPVERIVLIITLAIVVAVFLFVSIWGGAKVDRYNTEHHPTHQEDALTKVLIKEEQ